MSNPEIRFVDLSTQRERIGESLDKRIGAVLDHGQFILGPEVKHLEGELASFTGARNVVTCGSGTDALLLPLLAWGVGAGDAVIVPSFTFPASAEVIALLGATPVFADVDGETFNITESTLRDAVAATRDHSLELKAVMTVDLFGQPAADNALLSSIRELGIHHLGDAAQSFGGAMDGTAVGMLADVTATSFFPAKPLGCYGDGGAVFTDDDDTAAVLVSLRAHGTGSSKYEMVRIGTNGRLDTIQAAVLLAKLEVFAEECERRQVLADRYSEALSGVVATPVVVPGARSAWAQYTIRLDDRDDVASQLREEGVPTAVYYPVPMHKQVAYKDFPRPASGLPVSEQLAREVLSLPIHPYLTDNDQDLVIDRVISAVESR